jgi:hypothetical protein
MTAAEARDLVAGHEEGLAALVDEAPPLPAEAVAVLRATRVPSRRYSNMSGGAT